jgi:hypothetical protein
VFRRIAVVLVPAIAAACVETRPPPAPPIASHDAGTNDLAARFREPAVSSDGKLVAHAHVMTHGMLSDDFRALKLVDVASDRELETTYLAAGAEALDERHIAEVGARLGRITWSKLVPYPMSGWSASGEGLVIEFRRENVSIREARGGSVATIAKDYFEPPAMPKNAGPAECPPPRASVHAVYGEKARRLLVFIVRYDNDGDTCWWPQDVHHAVVY